MEDSPNSNYSSNIRKVLETEHLMNIIFDKLGYKDRLNLSLLNKKIYSFYQNRNKFLNTNINKPHSSYLQDIEISLLNNILLKYKNIKVIETLFDKEKLKMIDEAKLINLKKLKISCITSNFDPFLNMVNLKELYLYWNNWQDEITILSFLLNFPNLEILRLRDGKITDIEPIKELKKLKEFSMISVSKGTKENFKVYPSFHSFRDFLDYTPISYCMNLEGLYITGLYSIKLIENLTNLKELYLGGSSIQDLLPLTNLINLKMLDISIETKNIEPIKYLTNLEDLTIYYIHLSDISALSNLKNLKELNICQSNITDLEPIKELKNLEVLNLSKSRNLINISPLSDLINLKRL